MVSPKPVISSGCDLRLHHVKIATSLLDEKVVLCVVFHFFKYNMLKGGYFLLIIKIALSILFQNPYNQY